MRFDARVSRTVLVWSWAIIAIIALSGLPRSALAQSAASHHSVVRRWNELLLASIRNDMARPVVHARNLFHMSAAMWDAWAVWDEVRIEDGGPKPWLVKENDLSALPWSADGDREEARRASISYAAYGILRWRFADSPGIDDVSPLYDDLMEELGYPVDYASMVGSDPRAIGNQIAAAYIEFGLSDGSNEKEAYANRWYAPTNIPLLPFRSGTQGIENPDRWQPLSLQVFVDQSGNSRATGYPDFLGPEWGNVTPFSLREDQKTIHYDDAGNEFPVYLDPGPPPMLNKTNGFKPATEEQLKFLQGFEQVLYWSDHLDASDGVLIDASPNSIGNADLPADAKEDFSWFYDALNGGDAGRGYRRNPVTGKMYPKQEVPRADYARILAEFWSDGPDSETPPGHWFTILNDVMDHPLFQRRMEGTGPELDALEYDVKAYFALGGGVHDAAIAAWACKGRYDYVRPVSVIRWMAENGQRSDPKQDSYHPLGLELIPGQVEVITPESSQPGERHQYLRMSIGKIAVKCWRGPDYIVNRHAAGCGWILAINWWPYQRPTFVTPNFAGYVSGHSTFSRTAAEILTLLTGSEYFPGGLGEYVAPAKEYLHFEDGPTREVRLQWASYRDASDQCSLSRIWGGIHPPADDIPGRLMGKVIGPQVWEHATSHFGGKFNKGLKSKECPEDLNGDGTVDDADLTALYNEMGKECSLDETCDADLNSDLVTNYNDLIVFFQVYLRGGC